MGSSLAGGRLWISCERIVLVALFTTRQLNVWNRLETWVLENFPCGRDMVGGRSISSSKVELLGLKNLLLTLLWTESMIWCGKPEFLKALYMKFISGWRWGESQIRYARKNSEKREDLFTRSGCHEYQWIY